MIAALSGRAVSLFVRTSSAAPPSSAFAEATADKSPAAEGSGEIPSAVSSTHAVQSPLGASEKILAPHFRQTLLAVFILLPSHRLPQFGAITVNHLGETNC